MPLSKFHAASWLVWVAAAATIVQIAPNPTLLVLLLAVSSLVVATCSMPGPLARAFPQLLAVGAVFGLVRIALLSLTTHGVGEVWFSLPELTLPRLLGGFTVGGTIEGDVVLQAAAESLQLVALLGAFGAFNAVVAHHELVGLLPRSFHEVGLVITVALAFVPSTLEALHDVREADRSRSGGRPVRRRRTTRLLVPVLERGLDRAIALSESMDARGFGHQEPSRGERVGAHLALLSVVAVGAAGVALVGQEQVWAVTFLVLGLAGLAAATGISSRGRIRTRHRPRRLHRRDLIMALLSGSGTVLIVVASLLGDDRLSWTPGDGIPRVPLLGLLAVLCLLTPAAMARDAEPAPPDHDTVAVAAATVTDR